MNQNTSTIGNCHPESTAADTPDLSALIARRAFLGRTGGGIGTLALASLLSPELASAGEASSPTTDKWPGVVHPLHTPARIKRMIMLYMAGAPSHLESFDYKPELAKRHGQPFPESITKGQPIAQLQGTKLQCLGPQFPFKRYGESGQEISTLFPNIGQVADEICIIRSLYTDQINHDPAHSVMNTGTPISGRPSMGSWLLYGLGSMAENLPGFVVLNSVGEAEVPQPISPRQWGSGFLPGRFQGVEFYGQGEPVLYTQRPDGVTGADQRKVVDSVKSLNRLLERRVTDPEIATRIRQYELAFRMQTSLPELADLSDEPKTVLDAYGTQGRDGSFAANCLMARRLAERGVRFIQLYHRGWDHHRSVKAQMPQQAGEVDRACAALLKDLKQRGMLDETLVVWTGEFGRTPMGQNTGGRDHHIKGFSSWMAGGGIKPGITYGATDELGYHAAQDKVHVHDLQATILHLFGINHERLTFKFQGRDFRLTDVHGQVVRKILR